MINSEKYMDNTLRRKMPVNNVNICIKILQEHIFGDDFGIKGTGGHFNSYSDSIDGLFCIYHYDLNKYLRITAEFEVIKNFDIEIVFYLVTRYNTCKITRKRLFSCTFDNINQTLNFNNLDVTKVPIVLNFASIVNMPEVYMPLSWFIQEMSTNKKALNNNNDVFNLIDKIGKNYSIDIDPLKETGSFFKRMQDLKTTYLDDSISAVEGTVQTLLKFHKYKSLVYILNAISVNDSHLNVLFYLIIHTKNINDEVEKARLNCIERIKEECINELGFVPDKIDQEFS